MSESPNQQPSAVMQQVNAKVARDLASAVPVAAIVVNALFVLFNPLPPAALSLFQIFSVIVSLGAIAVALRASAVLKRLKYER